VSYSAFCTAVVANSLGTRCYAVDTWRGDSQAGEYGEEVFAEFRHFHDERYSTFSTLLRSTFDEAIEKFVDGSIDLLHIDGLHTYEAVHHDFNSWLPKLSNRAVVLFHDINEHSGDFGVWRLWAELRARYPHFELVHGHGLGLLAVGENIPSSVASLCAISDPSVAEGLRSLFARLGERWWYDTRERMAAADLQNHAAAAAALRETIQTVTDATSRLEAARAEDERRHAEAQERAQAALAAAEAARAEEERRRAEAEERAQAALHAANAIRTEDEQRRREAGEKARGALQAVEAARAREEQRRIEAEGKALGTLRAVEAANHRAALAERQHEDSLAELARARIELAEHASRADIAEALKSDAVRERDALVSSTLWRAMDPVRSIGRRLPAPARRLMRGTAKIAWWSATLSLPRKLRQRNAAIAAFQQQASLAAIASPTEPLLVSAEPAPRVEPVPLPPADFLTVVWISGEPETPGHTYRVTRPLAAAAANGARATWMRVDEVSARLPEVEDADVIVLWRTVWNDEVAVAVGAARRGGAKVVFDIDDLMIDPELARIDLIDGIRTQHLTEDVVQQHYGKIRAAMVSADLCLTTTDELAWHMRRAGMPTLVVPNSFSEETRVASRLAARKRAADTRAADGPIRIGYAGGTRTHQRDFALCAEAVADILRTHPECRLVVFRSAEHSVTYLDIHEFPALRGLEDRIEWRDLVPLHELPAEIARWDVNLAPLEVGNPFCEAKSELKFFEAALAGVPTVASPTGPFRRAIRHGETGFLATTADEWRQAIERLVDNAALRTKMAAAAERDVVWRFGPERTVDEMSFVLDLLQGGSSAARAFEVLTRRRQEALAPLPVVPDHELLFDQDRMGIAQVTVAVPLYNYAHTIIEALESARTQSMGALDLIIVDDRSTDDSLAVVLDWVHSHADRFNRVRVARNRANQGLGATRNVAFALADTPWLMALDADNRLRPNCVEACLTTAYATRAAFVYPVIERFGESEGLMGQHAWDPVRLSSGNYVDAMAMISRAAWAGVGGYDTTRTGWEDFDLWCRFVERGLWGERALGEPLAEYRVHGTSMIHSSMKLKEKVRWMMAHLEARHPWLTLPPHVPTSDSEEQDLVVPAHGASPVSVADSLRRLLPLLRCPVSGGRLSVTPDGQSLISEDNNHIWPLREGRPVLYPGMDAPRVADDSHLSNALPDSALALIHATRGPVLHLSAGGSVERFDNVIEAEAAIFRHTDLVADVHRLPFADAAFEAVITLNAFEHYRDPKQAAKEIMRVLKPGGRVLVRAAFLQPQHEAPWHFYNCTRFGLEAWFEGLETERLSTPPVFHAGYSISWLASECEASLRGSISNEAADRFLAAPLDRIIAYWRSTDVRRGMGDPIWEDLAALPQAAQEAVAAGFEYLGRRPVRVSSATDYRGSDPV
jgi:glycosyltransferase involved in cell wall biosynthesis/GT2 family glycosyltransferase/SAM-dependent methyltransferase